MSFFANGLIFWGRGCPLRLTVSGMERESGGGGIASVWIHVSFLSSECPGISSECPGIVRRAGLHLVFPSATVST